MNLFFFNFELEAEVPIFHVKNYSSQRLRQLLLIPRFVGNVRRRFARPLIFPSSNALNPDTLH